MDQDVLKIFPHLAFPKHAKLFHEKYDLISIVGPGAIKYSKRKLKWKTERICRFCGKGHSETGFSTWAHLIPQLIGNSDLYSEYECDACNAYFSSLENDLANYLGISRSILGINSDKKTKGFDARRLTAKSRSFIGDKILILAPEDIDRDPLILGKSTLKYTKNPFIPSNVYKAFLKSALSLLEDQEIEENYQLAIKYLQGKLDITSGAIIGGYKLSFLLDLPLHIYLFQKRDPCERTATHVMVFHFQNNIVALPLPFHKDDLKFDSQEMAVFFPPPYFTNEQNMEIAMPEYFRRDLASNVKITDEEERIVFAIDQTSINKTWGYDPATDTFAEKKYNPDSIKYIVMTAEGVTIDPKALSAFITKEMKVLQ